MDKPMELFLKAEEQLAKEHRLATEIQSKLDLVDKDLSKYEGKRKQLEQHLNRIKAIIVASKQQEHEPKPDQLKFDTYLSVAAEDGALTAESLKALDIHIGNLKQAVKVLTEKKYTVERNVLTVQVKLDSLKLRKDLSVFEITNSEVEDLRKYLELDNLESAIQELEAEAFAVKTVAESEKSIVETMRKDFNVNSFIQDVLDGKV